MSNVLAFSVAFNNTGPCPTCGVPVIVPAEYEANRRRDHGSFYCPNGHSLSFQGKSKEEKLKDELAQKDRDLAFERDRAARNYAAREKAERETQRLKKRISGGACPCCNRSFTNLQRHMATKHPDLAKE